MRYTQWEEIDSWLNQSPIVLPLFERLDILSRLITNLEKRKEEIISTAIAEGGKPRKDTEIEWTRAIDGIQIAISSLRNLSGQQIPMGLTPPSVGRIAFTIREPVGKVFAISAFNHPINLIIHQVIPAVAVGCPVLIRPASKTPLSCQNLVEALYASGLPMSHCLMVICDHEVAEKIVKDHRIRFFSFIGSSTVGWRLRSLLAPGVISAFEHGGAAAVIIGEDYDLEKCIPLIVKGAFYHSGQVCVSVQRVFVPANKALSFCNLLAKAAGQLKVGNPDLATTDIGPLISDAELRRVKKFIDDAVENGGQIITGNQVVQNTCLQPTVIFNPASKALISTQEIFGPVVAIYPYEDLDVAIDGANATNYCFQASIFTENLEQALKAFRQLKATTVLINEHTAFRVDWMPFGGRLDSGQGVGGIPYSMREMTYEKQIIIRSAQFTP